ncbi:MAG TPA: tryptophan synthase subunit beta, partial [Candidatus Brevibacterium intestinigallinarum]|nr:tryptophan synthase subunit beta [Candidatus Brevibacterium intestinigallinarum]
MTETIEQFSRPDADLPQGPRFGDFGGRFIPEALVPACEEIEEAFAKAVLEDDFRAEYRQLLAEYVGRPSLLSEAARFSEHAGGARILLKREDLNHTGSH